MKKIPNNIVYSKVYAKKPTQSSKKGSKLRIFSCGLITSKGSYLTYNQIEACRITIGRHIRAQRKVNKFHRKLILSRLNVKQKKRSRQRRKKLRLLLRPNFCFPLTKKPYKFEWGKEKALCILGQRLKVNHELSLNYLVDITVYNVFINYFDIPI
jgi:hypothetical protein